MKGYGAEDWGEFFCLIHICNPMSVSVNIHLTYLLIHNILSTYTDLILIHPSSPSCKLDVLRSKQTKSIWGMGKAFLWVDESMF